MTLCLPETKRAVQRQRPPGRVLRERAEHILAGSYEFVASTLFGRRGIEATLMGIDAEPELPPIGWYQPTIRDAAFDKARDAVRRMTAEEEKLMFYRFNYSKKRLQELQKSVRRDGLTTESAEELVMWHRRFAHYREYLVRTNLALVLAMAKRTRQGRMDLAEIVSEGNLALLRSMDKFDAGRGFKFSTYACQAIVKSFFRASMKASRYRSRCPVEFSVKMEKSDWPDRRRTIEAEECAEELRIIFDGNLAELSEVEQTVIRLRFNWKEAEAASLTLQEVGQIIGRTKERVRQIQNMALRKIRRVMDSGVPFQKRPADEMAQTEAFAPGQVDRQAVAMECPCDTPGDLMFVEQSMCHPVFTI